MGRGCAGSMSCSSYMTPEPRLPACLVPKQSVHEWTCYAGTLPASFSNIVQLAELECQENFFAGPLPPQWGIDAMPRLKILNLSSNQVLKIRLSGMSCQTHITCGCCDIMQIPVCHAYKPA